MATTLYPNKLQVTKAECIEASCLNAAFYTPGACQKMCKHIIHYPGEVKLSVNNDKMNNIIVE